jgi:site-specific DNA recombinase
MPEAAAIYARISLDTAGDELGIRRQLADCRAKAGQLGWSVAEEYVDNDVSAYNAKTRPAYERMLADIRDRRIDAVLVYHMDRLTRRPRELEEFIEACDQTGLKHVTTVQGDLDIGTGDGLMVTRLLSILAAWESDTKSRRVTRKMQERAEAGLPHGGRRPFGFEEDRLTIREPEARVVRELAERFLAGEPITSLVRWLNEQEIPTATGNTRWRATSLRDLLRSARISGQREHQGQIVGSAAWDAIITPQQTERIRAILEDPTRKSRRAVRRYLLAGFLRCHRCGHPMYSNPRHGVRRYICKGGADYLGCGRTYINAEPVEQLICESVLHRLDTPEFVAQLAGEGSSEGEAAALSQQIIEDQAQLDELATLYAEREIRASEWKTARKVIEARQRTAQRRLARLKGTSTLDGLAYSGSELRRQWAALDLNRQRAIVEAVMDHAIVGPGQRGGNTFDRDRVRPVWRL